MKMTQAKLLRHISRTLLHEIDHKPTTAVQCSDTSSGQNPQERNGMTKEQLLEMIKLLSALESWSFSAGQRMPDYLFEKIDKAMDELTREVLK